MRSDVMEFLLGCCPFLRVCYMYNTINIMRQNSRHKVIFLDKKMASFPAYTPYFDVALYEKGRREINRKLT